MACPPWDDLNLFGEYPECCFEFDEEQMENAEEEYNEIVEERSNLGKSYPEGFGLISYEKTPCVNKIVTVDKERKNKRGMYSSWVFRSNLNDEVEIQKLLMRLEYEAKKTIIIYDSAHSEVLGYVQFPYLQSKNCFGLFWESLDFVPAKGGCNENA